MCGMCAQGFGTLCFGERAAFWQARKSRAEREDPDGVAAICEEAAPVLDDWEPEDIDLRPPTLEGVPDILIDDRLVMEVNRKLNKAERDRQVGQYAGYSREWVNPVVLIDTPARRVRELEELLAVKGLVHILVFSFFNAPIGLLPLAGSGGGR